MIDHQTFEVKHTMTQTFTLKVQQKESTVETSSDKLTLTCVNMHAFRKSGFTSSITMKYWQAREIDESWHYGLLNFKCLTTNHATFDNQLFTLRSQQQ